jgi:hypothetical protein
MKKLILIISLAISVNAFAQDADKTVTLVVSGQGKTQDEAKQVALRSAIEQAFGAFISSKTEILNDSLVKDEIMSVSNGNIQKFELISELEIPDGGFVTTLQVTVSVTKLSNFVEAKGIAVEIKGGQIAQNIKQLQLNENAELKNIQNLCEVSMSILSKSIDFDLKVSEPVAVPQESNNFFLPIQVNYKTNNNQNIFYNYFMSTLKSLSMSQEEFIKYQKMKKPIQCIKTPDGMLYLKSLEGIRILKKFIVNSNRFIFDFIVVSDIDTIKLQCDRTENTHFEIEGNLESKSCFYNMSFFEKSPIYDEQYYDKLVIGNIIEPIFNAGSHASFGNSIPDYPIYKDCKNSDFYSGLYFFLEIYQEQNGLNKLILALDNDETGNGAYDHMEMFLWFHKYLPAYGRDIPITCFNKLTYSDSKMKFSRMHTLSNIPADILIRNNKSATGSILIKHKLSLSMLEKISKYNILKFKAINL